MNARRRITTGDARAQAEAYREFQHRQNIRRNTETLGFVDGEPVEITRYPALGDLQSERSVEISYPLPEREDPRPVDLPELDGGRLTFKTHIVAPPKARARQDYEPEREAYVRWGMGPTGLRLFLPATWTASDVLAWLRYAHMIQMVAVRGDRPRIVESLLASLQGRGEPPTTLVNAPWVPTAGQITLSDWILTHWLVEIVTDRERRAVAMATADRPLRQIAREIGLSSNTNHAKRVIRQGCERIARYLNKIGRKPWPRLRDVEIVVDETGER